MRRLPSRSESITIKGKSKNARIETADDKSVEIVVKLNLRTQKILYTANGVTIEAEIQRPLKSITHVGYVIDSALIDFAPVEVNAQ